jgi:hypothetical protein
MRKGVPECAQRSKIMIVSRTEITERIPRRFVTDVHSDPKSFDPQGQLPDVEIDQETNRAAGELEVREILCLMDCSQFLHGLHNNHGVFDQQVNPVTAIESHTLVNHGQDLLAFHLELLLPQFVGEARVIGRFEQPGSKRPMNLDRSPDDSLCDPVDLILFDQVPLLGVSLCSSLSDLCVLCGSMIFKIS